MRLIHLPANRHYQAAELKIIKHLCRDSLNQVLLHPLKVGPVDYRAVKPHTGPINYVHKLFHLVDSIVAEVCQILALRKDICFALGL